METVARQEGYGVSRMEKEMSLFQRARAHSGDKLQPRQPRELRDHWRSCPHGRTHHLPHIGPAPPPLHWFRGLAVALQSKEVSILCRFDTVCGSGLDLLSSQRLKIQGSVPVFSPPVPFQNSAGEQERAMARAGAYHLPIIISFHPHTQTIHSPHLQRHLAKIIWWGGHHCPQL